MSLLKSSNLCLKSDRVQFESKIYTAHTPTIYCKSIYKDFNLQKAIITHSRRQALCRDVGNDHKGRGSQTELS